jgi:hypothetical protein
VRWPGIGAQEEVGAFEKRRGLRDGHPPCPVAERWVGLEHSGGVGILRPADHDDAPAVREKPVDENLPVGRGPPLGGCTCPEMSGE